MTDVALADFAAQFDTQSTTVLQGPVISVTRDVFDFYGEVVERQVVRHPGAVGVVALRGIGAATEILLVRQYRHPVGQFLWELPAGLCDVAGESAEQCAHRELLEETGHIASSLEHLVTAATSPGGSDEQITLFLAQDPRQDSQMIGTQEPEERHMLARWFPLTAALAAVQAGTVVNAIAQLGICLAALRVRQSGLE